MKSVLVVIPTTGKDLLYSAVKSVIDQTYQNITCLVVIDGPEYAESSNKILSQFPSVKILQLPWNIGRPDWYGHRTYSFTPAITNEDYWVALDQDNFFLPEHIETMVDTCETNNWAWCHSLRKIYDKLGNYVCDDDCESLGRYPIYLNNDHHLVDTSTYCIKKEVIVGLAPAWYSGWGGDRRFYSIISQHVPNFGCTGKYTVGYRVDGNNGSVNSDFFIKGNEIMKARYPNGFPWRKS